MSLGMQRTGSSSSDDDDDYAFLLFYDFGDDSFNMHTRVYEWPLLQSVG